MDSDSNGLEFETDLATQWAAERCPIIDGIVFADGRVKLVAADWQKQENGRLGIVIQPGEWTTLAELHVKNELHWTNITSLTEVEDVSRGIRVSCGESGYGSDGFVASVSADSGKIVWIAFFSTSNPFDSVQIQDDQVLARTNLGTLWRFPLDAPNQVTLM